MFVASPLTDLELAFLLRHNTVHTYLGIFMTVLPQ